MQVNAADFDFNNNLNSILGSIPVNPVPVGQCTTLVPNLQADVCSDAAYLATVFVEANPPNGNICQDQDQVLVSVSSLPPP